MKILNKSLQDISQHQYLRNDFKYWNTMENYVFSNYSKLNELFEIVKGSVQTDNYCSEKTNIPYIRIGDLSYKFGISDENLQFLNDDSEIANNKILNNTDIILATIGATVGKACQAKKFAGGTFSNNTVVLRLRNAQDYPEFFEKVLQTDFYINYIFGVVSQKAQPNLQMYDLENIRIPIIENETKLELLKRIKPYEESISELHQSIQSIQRIIDCAFQGFFGFDYNKFNELRQHKNITQTPFDISNNCDLRFSAKFHRDSGNFVMQELTSRTDKKIKHYLAEPIVLGASVSPSDYSDDGEFCYISMATIKNWKFDSESASIVSKEYSDSKQAKTVQKNDIILARSGEGTIGKVALIDDDELQGVFADFTMRIRLKDYNPEFAYYYFRTTYFQYLIEIYKKGLGNNTNIFPIVVREFPMLDISLAEQQRIVDEIHAEIAKQEEIKKQIESLRGQIDVLIQEVLTGSQG